MTWTSACRHAEGAKVVALILPTEPRLAGKRGNVGQYRAERLAGRPRRRFAAAMTAKVGEYDRGRRQKCHPVALERRVPLAGGLRYYEPTRRFISLQKMMVHDWHTSSLSSTRAPGGRGLCRGMIPFSRRITDEYDASMDELRQLLLAVESHGFEGNVGRFIVGAVPVISYEKAPLPGSRQCQRHTSGGGS